MGIADRKREHVELALTESSQSAVAAGWDDVQLIPAALPGLDPGDVDLTTDLAGHALDAPLVLVGMTGGFAEAEQLNATLGAAAQRLGLAVGVGSQRAALVDPTLERSFAAIRDRAPDATVIANIGACQLVDQDGEPPLTEADVRRVIAMVDADLLAVHLNVVQELVQPEGDRRFAGLEGAIAELVSWSPVPVLVKETGAGIDRESAERLAGAGVAVLDVGGVGGTSFARIEGGRAARAAGSGGSARAAGSGGSARAAGSGGSARAAGSGGSARVAEQGSPDHARLGATFADWGVPAAASVLEVRGAGLPVVATGGVRTGLDAARALALGATAAGLGRPAIIAAGRGDDALVRELEVVLGELRTALLLAGARTPAELRSPVITGATLAWARQRALLD